MKIVHVIPHVDQEAAGPSYSVPRLCESLAAVNNEVELTCLAARAPIPGVNIDLHRQWPLLSRFAISSSLVRALRRKAERVDIIHNHSLWSMINVASGWVVPGHRAKFVTSPRGTLSLWALSRARVLKRILWPFQLRALEKADLLHATSESEYREIRRLGLKAPVAIVPNGVDLPALPAERISSAQCTLLFLGRIHPTKGIDLLLEAWRELQDVHRHWKLVIAGNGEAAYERQMHELSSSLELQRVEFPGPLYGDAKSAAYLNAQLFVLPTHSENFGMAIAEALAHGCPAVVSQGAPWSGLELEGCGWWVPHDVATLKRTLDSAMHLQRGQLSAMGAKGRAWMERDFSWRNVAVHMEAAYRWVISGGVKPECVRLIEQ